MKQLEGNSFFCWGICFATGEVEKELEKGKYDLAHLHTVSGRNELSRPAIKTATMQLPMTWKKISGKKLSDQEIKRIISGKLL